MQSTTSPDLRSFVPTPANSHFPIQNLPYGVFRPRAGGAPRVGVAVGEMILDLAALESRSLLKIPVIGQAAGRSSRGRRSMHSWRSAARLGAGCANKLAAC
ncbi:MAG TPA: hypothetical protein VHB99_14690 [Pirellulales bacterium]|nr:hypothetical protein [Pirellulales bacterium]